MPDLIEVSFRPGDRTVWIRRGATILEASEAAGVEIVTGCTHGQCGTDPVFVAAGGEGLEPPGEDERATLDRMGLEPSFRLACSARLADGPVVVELGRF